MNALLNGLITLAGFAALAAIGIHYPRSRMFTAPLAGIWLTFWVLQAAEAMGVSYRIRLLVVAMIAAAAATFVAVNIPYTIADRRQSRPDPTLDWRSLTRNKLPPSRRTKAWTCPRK